MEISKYISKKKLIYICIIIVIFIIIRILYYTLYYDLEHFASTDNLITDLLSKYKSTNAQQIADPNNINTEMQIKSWNNKIYNMQNTTQQSKAISFYKPNLLINNELYCKLGDIVSQNTDYSIPTADQFTLLVKKNVSDIKQPIRFDLVVDIGYNKFNSEYNDYSIYINNSINISNIDNSLKNCASAINNLNSLIQNNLSIIQNTFVNDVLKNIRIRQDNLEKGPDSITLYKLINNIGINVIEGFNSTTIISRDTSTDSSYADLINMLNIRSSSKRDIQPINNINENNIEDNIEDSSYTDFLNPLNTTPSQIINNQQPTTNSIINYSFPVKDSNVLISLPAGITGSLSYTIDNKEKNIDISIPSNLDSDQDSDKTKIINKLPLVPYGSVITEPQLEFVYTNSKMFKYIPTVTLINYIISLCNDIKNIYNSNSDLFIYLNLATDLNSVTQVLRILNDMLEISNSKKDFDIIIAQLNPIMNNNNTNTLLGLVLWIIKNMPISYISTVLNFRASNIKQDITYYTLKITGFNNDIISNIIPSTYNIVGNNIINNNKIINININNIIPNINRFATFVSNFNNNTLPLFPLKIYKPIAPDNYISLGHVFCIDKKELQKIIDSNNVACIPSQCVKEIRDWKQSDKIFEYNKDNKYFGLFYNPYTGTFVSTNTNSQQLPDGKVCKVVACVKKCDAIDKLKKSDECARNYYNLNKNANSKTQLSSNLLSNQEEEFYLDKIKSQSDSISRLQTRAQNMQIDIDKATIVNREMNKNKLQDYVDTQKRNIDIIMKRLKDDKNKIETNINAPLDTINAIIQMIKDSQALTSQQKNSMIKQIVDIQTKSNNNLITYGDYINNLNNILNSCPQYDLTGLVKKTQVSDVCYGCDNPE